jgi:hypothetical protein
MQRSLMQGPLPKLTSRCTQKFQSIKIAELQQVLTFAPSPIHELAKKINALASLVPPAICSQRLSVVLATANSTDCDVSDIVRLCVHAI